MHLFSPYPARTHADKVIDYISKMAVAFMSEK